MLCFQCKGLDASTTARCIHGFAQLDVSHADMHILYDRLCDKLSEPDAQVDVADVAIALGGL